MNAMNTLIRPGTSESELNTPESGANHHNTDNGQQRPTHQPRIRRDADSMAVAAFVLGLTGLLVFNLVLGPCALVLGGLALIRGTSRRARAGLGIALGAADLAVLAVTVAASGSAAWSITG